MTIKNTGVIGLGAMGYQMARHMVSKGFVVTGYDVAPEAMSRAMAAGVKPAKTADIGRHRTWRHGLSNGAPHGVEGLRRHRLRRGARSDEPRHGRWREARENCRYRASSDLAPWAIKWRATWCRRASSSPATTWRPKR